LPWFKTRMNSPNVDGAYTPPNSDDIPPVRGSSASSMLSALVTIAATSVATFPPGLAPR
jgi:hypothetical protein